MTPNAVHTSTHQHISHSTIQLQQLADQHVLSNGHGYFLLFYSSATVSPFFSVVTILPRKSKECKRGIFFLFLPLYHIWYLNSVTICITMATRRNCAQPPLFKEDLSMAYVINDGCLECGACAAQCPVEAIAEA